jgi:hypothetical protein
MVLRRTFPTAVCEKMFGEKLGPGNEPCEGWNQPVLLKTPRRLEPPVGNKCNCHEWDELVSEFIADFARVHRLDGSRMALAREETAVRETGEPEAIHALIAAHHKFGKRPPPDREPQTTHGKHDTRPVTAVGFASINVEIRT